MRRPWVNQTVLPVCILAVYFAVPISGHEAPLGVAVGAVIAVFGLAAVARIVFDEVQRAEKRLRLIHLVLALELVVVIFSLGYFTLAVTEPAEFTGLETRLDALYFSMTTVSTVGYGDVSASGQWARLLVIIQLGFNLAFVGALVGLVQGRLHLGGRRGRRPEPGDAES